VFVIAVCPRPDLFAAERQWVRDLTDALTPLARTGAYVNGVTDSAPDQVKVSYGAAKWQRLREIKTAVDPTNVFHRNHNIPPLA
jgi:FAD/FMN-containing dehydrogenase